VKKPGIFEKGLASALLAVTLGVGVAPLAVAQEQAAAAEAAEPAGFVWFSRKGLGLIIGGSTGGGRLQFAGDNHTFRMTGIKLGALGGVGEIRMSGEVYNLKQLQDFEGNYTESVAGLSAIVGGGGVWLENDKGVKMHLKAEATGVGVDISVGSVEVKLGMVD
jgi:hypothetical protein